MVDEPRPDPALLTKFHDRLSRYIYNYHPVEVVHVWNCENDEYKQALLCGCIILNNFIQKNEEQVFNSMVDITNHAKSRIGATYFDLLLAWNVFGYMDRSCLDVKKESRTSDIQLLQSVQYSRELQFNADRKRSSQVTIHCGIENPSNKSEDAPINYLWIILPDGSYNRLSIWRRFGSRNLPEGKNGPFHFGPKPLDENYINNRLLKPSPRRELVNCKADPIDGDFAFIHLCTRTRKTSEQVTRSRKRKLNDNDVEEAASKQKSSNGCCRLWVNLDRDRDQAQIHRYRMALAARDDKPYLTENDPEIHLDSPTSLYMQNIPKGGEAKFSNIMTSNQMAHFKMHGVFPPDDFTRSAHEKVLECPCCPDFCSEKPGASLARFARNELPLYMTKIDPSGEANLTNQTFYVFDTRRLGNAPYVQRIVDIVESLNRAETIHATTTKCRNYSYASFKFFLGTTSMTSFRLLLLADSIYCPFCASRQPAGHLCLHAYRFQIRQTNMLSRRLQMVPDQMRASEAAIREASQKRSLSEIADIEAILDLETSTTDDNPQPSTSAAAAMETIVENQYNVVSRPSDFDEENDNEALYMVVCYDFEVTQSSFCVNAVSLNFQLSEGNIKDLSTLLNTDPIELSDAQLIYQNVAKTVLEPVAFADLLKGHLFPEGRLVDDRFFMPYPDEAGCFILFDLVRWTFFHFFLPITLNTHYYYNVWITDRNGLKQQEFNMRQKENKITDVITADDRSNLLSMQDNTLTRLTESSLAQRQMLYHKYLSADQVSDGTYFSKTTSFSSLLPSSVEHIQTFEETMERITQLDEMLQKDYIAALRKNTERSDIIMDALMLLQTFLIVQVSEEKKRCGRNDKSGFLFLAHNGGRFDILLLMRPLINNLYMPPLNDLICKQPDTILNNGRLLQLRIDFNNNVVVFFRDTIQYVPTASKSLAGASAEMRIPGAQKMSLSFWTMDVISELLSIMFYIYHSPEFLHHCHEFGEEYCEFLNEESQLLPFGKTIGSLFSPLILAKLFDADPTIGCADFYKILFQPNTSDAGSSSFTDDVLQGCMKRWNILMIYATSQFSFFLQQYSSVETSRDGETMVTTTPLFFFYDKIPFFSPQQLNYGQVLALPSGDVDNIKQFFEIHNASLWVLLFDELSEIIFPGDQNFCYFMFVFHPLFLFIQTFRYSAYDAISLGNLWNFMVEEIYCAPVDNEQPRFTTPSKLISSCITATGFAFRVLRHYMTSKPFYIWNTRVILDSPVIQPTYYAAIDNAESTFRRALYGGRSDGRIIGISLEFFRDRYVDPIVKQTEFREKFSILMRAYETFIQSHGIKALVDPKLDFHPGDDKETIVNYFANDPSAIQTTLFMRFLRKHILLYDRHQYPAEVVALARHILFRGLHMLDIVSHYPSSLCLPIPHGPVELLSEEERNQINLKLKDFFDIQYEAMSEAYRNGKFTIEHRFPFCSFPPGIFICRLTRPLLLHSYEKVNCNIHGRSICSSLPYHDASESGRLYFPSGAEVLYGVLSIIDIGLCCEDAWLVEIVDYNIVCEKYGNELNEFQAIGTHYYAYRNYCFTAWSNRCESFYRTMYQFKGDAKKAGQSGRERCYKICMNGSYGQTTYDANSKTSYHVFHKDDHSISDQVLANKNTQKAVKVMVPLTESANILSFDKSQLPSNHPFRKDNSRPLEVGIFCLSNSRLIFKYCFRDKFCASNDFLEEGEEKIPPIIAYCDTDSALVNGGSLVTFPLAYTSGPRLAKFPRDQLPYIETDMRAEYESGGGNSYCPTLSTDKVRLACIYGNNYVLAKKLYSFQCIGCGNTKTRARGHRAGEMLHHHYAAIISFARFVYTQVIEKICPDYSFYEDYNLAPGGKSIDLFTPSCFMESDVIKSQLIPNQEAYNQHRLVCSSCTDLWSNLLSQPDLIASYTPEERLIFLSREMHIIRKKIDSRPTIINSFKISFYSATQDAFSITPRPLARVKRSRGDSPFAFACHACSVMIPDYITQDLRPNYVKYTGAACFSNAHRNISHATKTPAYTAQNKAVNLITHPITVEKIPFYGPNDAEDEDELEKLLS